MAAPSSPLSPTLRPPSASSPPLSLPSTVRFGQPTRRAVSERHPIPSFVEPVRDPPRVTIIRPDERGGEDDELRGRTPSTDRSSHASTSSNQPTDDTDHSDEIDDDQPPSALEITVGPAASKRRKTSSVDAGDGTSPSRRDTSSSAHIEESSESIADDTALTLSPSANGGRKRAITWGGTARPYPLSPPPLETPTTKEPAESPFFHQTSNRNRSASSSHRHHQHTQPHSTSPGRKVGPSSSTPPRARRKSRPPPLQTNLLAPSASSFNNPSSSPSHPDYPPPPSGRSSSSSSPFRNHPSPHGPRSGSPSRPPSASGSHLLASINDSEDDDSTSNNSPSRPRKHSAMSHNGNRPASRSVSISSQVRPSELRRNSSSSSALHLSGRESSISRKGKERERDDAAEKEREKKERKAAEKREQERARRYREMQQDQVGRNDFGFGAGSGLGGTLGASAGGMDMLGLGGGMRSLDPANEATLDAFLGQTDLRAALRSVSTAAPNGQPPASPSQLPASQTGSIRTTPSKSKTTGPPPVLSPTSNHFPPTPTQTSFPLFKRESTQDTLVSPTSATTNGRTRTASHSSGLTLSLGKSASTSGLSGKLGAKDGAHKLRKVFAIGHKVPEKAGEPEATGPEGEAKLLETFERKIRRAEAALISHPNTVAAAELYKTAMTHRYAVIFQPLAAGEKPLSLLDVARWKEKTLEVQRRAKALESSRAARSVVDGEGWRSTDSFGRGGASSYGSPSLPRSASVAIPGRSSTGGNMSTSSFEDGSVSGQLRNFRFGATDGTVSTQRTSRSSAGLGSSDSHYPYLLSSARKEKIFPWTVDPHDVVLFAEADGKIDETLDLGAAKRSADDYHSLSRTGSALPSVQEVLDGSAPPTSPGSSPYGGHRAEHAALYPSPDRFSSRRSLSPLPGSHSRPSSPLATGQSAYFPLPNSGLSPPRPPNTLTRSASHTRRGASRTQLANLLTSPAQLARPHLGEHTVTTPLAMTPAVVNLSDRRGSLPEGNSSHLPRHMHHQSLSGIPSASRGFTQSLTPRGSTPSSPHPGGLSPPAPTYGHRRPVHNRRVSDGPLAMSRLTPSTPLHASKPSYSTRAKAANKKLADGIDSAGSGDELSRAGGNRSEGDVPGARSTKSSLSKRSSGNQDGHHLPRHMFNRVGTMFTNSRDVSPQASDVEDGPLVVGPTGMKKVGSVASGISGTRRAYVKGKVSSVFKGSGSRRGTAGLEMTKGGESEFREDIGLGLDEQGFEEIAFEGPYEDDLWHITSFSRREGWELDRPRAADELEVEKEEIRNKAEFLSSTRAKLPTYASLLTQSSTTFDTLHSQYLAYPLVAKDLHSLSLPCPALPHHLLTPDDPLSPTSDLLPSVAAACPQSDNDTLGPLHPRPRSGSVSKPRRRSSISVAASAGGGTHFQLQRQLLKHQAAAATALDSSDGEKERKDWLAELEHGLKEVEKGWEELYEWAKRIVARREELYRRFERSEPEYERVVRVRERKRRDLEPRSLDPVRSRSSAMDSFLGYGLEKLLQGLAFVMWGFYQAGSLFARGVWRGGWVSWVLRAVVAGCFWCWWTGRWSGE